MSPCCKRTGVLGVGLSLLLAACVAPLSATFDAHAAEAIFTSGNGILSGRAYMRSRTGYLFRCHAAYLIPVTAYADRWMAELFVGTNDYAPRANVEGMPDDPGFAKYRRKADCDSDGRFAFAHVADGAYYVLVPIYWDLRWQRNGGVLMRKVTLTEGEQRKLVLTHNAP